ncbi:MAG: hypothetical protein GWO20_16630 [Candidatus Korarchaeota archaeon]|nr:hypothetical protein [Candidatus Korarchaeota archaeon]
MRKRKRGLYINGRLLDDTRPPWAKKELMIQNGKISEIMLKVIRGSWFY